MREGRPTRGPLGAPTGTPAFHLGESAEAPSGRVTTGRSAPWRPRGDGGGWDTTGQATRSRLAGLCGFEAPRARALRGKPADTPRLQVKEKTPGPPFVTPEGQALLPAAGLPSPVLGRAPLGQGLPVTLTVRCAGHAADH